MKTTTTLGLSILALGLCNAKGNKTPAGAAKPTTPAVTLLPETVAKLETAVAAVLGATPAQPPLPVIEATPAAAATAGSPPASPAPKRRSSSRSKKSLVPRLARLVQRDAERYNRLATRVAGWGETAGITALARDLRDAAEMLSHGAAAFKPGADDDGNLIPAAIPADFVPPKNDAQRTRGAGRAERAAVLKVGESVEIRTAKRELYADGCDAEKPLTVYKAPREGGKSVMLTDADGIRVSVAIDHVLLVGVEAARKAAREARVAKRNAAK